MSEENTTDPLHINARGNTHPVQWIDDGDYCSNIGIDNLYYNSNTSGNLSFDPRPMPLVVNDTDYKVVLKIYPDGKLELDPENVDEAAERLMDAFFRKASYVLSLEAELEASKTKITELENRLTSAMTRGLSNPNR